MYGILRIIQTVFMKLLHFDKIKVSGYINMKCDTKISTSQNGHIIFGKNITTKNNVYISTVGGIIEIGDDVFFNRNCMIVCRDSIRIGKSCSFGPNVCLYDHDHKFGNDGIQPGYNLGPIVIESKCWIGANVTILRNTHIGEGCIIGAGTIVKGDIPPKSVVTNDRSLKIRPLD